ncbi:hypothetical protein AB3N02_26945 [Priestia aryabhattai]|uniref:hypothetical protein n=1 Tax=Priestia aryabhattai TaxID=412384 RepID=UPI0039A1F3D0
MFIVTNPKVKGFVPEWSQFKGFSILFDNPADVLLPLGEDKKLKVLTCDKEFKELSLYKQLHETLSLFPELSTTYLLCSLPFHSYHVTLWDGINDANLQDISYEYRFAAEDLVKHLPYSLLQENEFLSINSEFLNIKMDKATEFKFDKLTQWGNTVLAARLKPANTHSEKMLHELEQARNHLIKIYKDDIGIETCEFSYAPHVTLGYFANKELAELSNSRIEHWNEQFLIHTSGHTITFKSNSLYAFIDMATFIKK